MRENALNNANAKSRRMIDPRLSLTSILSRWERRPRRPRLGEGRARDRSVERDDLQTGTETDSLSQRERNEVRENAT